MARITLHEWSLAKIEEYLAQAEAHRALAAVHLARWAEIWRAS